MITLHLTTEETEIVHAVLDAWVMTSPDDEWTPTVIDVQDAIAHARSPTVPLSEEQS